MAMHSSVETRYPFLDEDLIAFCARLHPKYKLNRMREKWLLRRFAKRILPEQAAMRPKKMFRAPMWGSFCGFGAPEFVDQLLSPAALNDAGYFEPQAIARARAEYPRLNRFSPRRAALDMGLINVLATQLWHHTFIDGSLVDLPCWRPSYAKPDTERPAMALSLSSC